MSDGTELATRVRPRPLPHEVADTLARQQATDGEIIVALVRECGVDRSFAAQWVGNRKSTLEDARLYGCVELRRWLWSVAIPEVDADGKRADARQCFVGSASLKATELLSRAHLGMTLEGAMEKVAKQAKGKAA